MWRAAILLLLLALLSAGVAALLFLPRPESEPGGLGQGREELGKVPSDLAGEPSDASAPAIAGGPASPSPPGSPVTQPAGRDPDRAGDEESALASGSIAGRLVDASGRSIAGAAVLVARAPDLSVSIERSAWWITHLPLDVADPAALGAEFPVRADTDEAGRFRLEGVEPGRIRLAARSGRHAPLDRNDVRLAAGEALDLGDLKLEAASVLSGRLTDGEGRPVLGVPIVPEEDFFDSTLFPLSPTVGVLLATTDRHGDYRSVPIAPGPWSVRALGGRDLEDRVLRGPSISEGWNRLDEMTDSTGLAGCVRTRGRIPTDLVVRALPAERSRSPVPFACRAEAREASVQRDGSFSLSGIVPGVLYELRAGIPAAAWEDESPWSPPAFAYDSEAGAGVSWEPDASITFEIVGAGDHLPLANGEVELTGARPERSILTPGNLGPGGERSIPAVRLLRSRLAPALIARSRGHAETSRLLALRPGSGAAIGTIELPRLPVLHVLVLDGRTGRPVSGALVTSTQVATGFDPSGLSACAVATDAAGRAVVDCFSGAGSQVEIRARGFATARRAGPFGGGFIEPRLEVRLFRGASVRIQVVDGGGRPVRGARVEWIEGDWSPNELSSTDGPHGLADRPDPRFSRVTDVDGRTAFAHVPPGRNAFRVRRGSSYLDGEWTERELREGEELEIALESRPRATLELRVADGGLALAGAPVALIARDLTSGATDLAEADTPLPPGLDAHLDSLGACTFGDIEAGPYVIAFAAPAQRRRVCRSLTVAGGRNSVAIDLAATAVSGRVVGVEGRPVAGAVLVVADPVAEQNLRDAGRRRRFEDLPPSEILALGLEHAAALTGEDGTFRILGLPAGTPFSILARADPAGVGKSDPVVLESDSQPLELEIPLRPAGAIEVQIPERPLSTPLVLLAIPSDHKSLPRMRLVYPGQTVLLGALVPGTWQIELRSEDAPASHRRSVEVAAGSVLPLDLTLP